MGWHYLAHVRFDLYMRLIGANTPISLLSQHLFDGLYDTESWKLYFKASPVIWKHTATWHLDSYLSFIIQLIYLMLQWKNFFVEENTTWISSSFLHQIRQTLRGEFSSLCGTRIPKNRHLCLSFPICEEWRSIWLSEFLFDNRKYEADSAQFHLTFLGPFDLKAQNYAKPHLMWNMVHKKKTVQYSIEKGCQVIVSNEVILVNYSFIDTENSKEWPSFCKMVLQKKSV